MILSTLLLTAFAAIQEPAALPAASAAPSAESADVSIQMGLKAFRHHRFAQAEIDFRRAMEAEPSSAAATFYLAYTYYKMVEPKRPFHPGKQKAAELFARAYELDPTFKPVWNR